MRALLLGLLLSGCYLSHRRDEPDAAHVSAADVREDVAPDPGCAAEDAHPVHIVPERIAELFFWRWSGHSCVYERYTSERTRGGQPVLPPLGCAGEDCATLTSDEADCVARFAHCGAVVERPRRGVAFSRPPTASIACAELTCAPSVGCGMGIRLSCRPDDGTPHVACDDDLDCGAGLHCCAGDLGSYPESTCRAACEADEARTCLSDADCGPGASCCEALTHFFGTFTDMGACTPRACDPASQRDF